jgi:hypothetical protein
MNSVELYAEADRLTAQAMRLRCEAYELRKQELADEPRAKRLVYASNLRCTCGAGMAYDPAPLMHTRTTVWRCSSILLGLGLGLAHRPPVREGDTLTVMSEHDAHANGHTTRPDGARSDAA